MSALVSAGPAPRRANAPVGADVRALETAIDACVRAYPRATRARVEELLLSFYERTGGARVQQYRVVLAERDTRVQLRREERASLDGDLPGDPPSRRPMDCCDSGPDARRGGSPPLPSGGLVARC